MPSADRRLQRISMVRSGVYRWSFQGTAGIAASPLSIGFSQTVGHGRGLDDLIAALPLHPARS